MIHDIRHPPWVAADYRSNRIRTLILGDSHYHSNSEARDLTVGVVNEWLNGTQNLRFFTGVAIALSGDEPGTLNRPQVFDNIAFYNYVQEVVDSSRKRPPATAYQAAEAPFREILIDLAPTHIIV